MRILQLITRSDLGGAQSVVVNLANKLCEEHEVIVVAGEGDGKMWELLDLSVKREEFSFLRRALSPINDIRTLSVWCVCIGNTGRISFIFTLPRLEYWDV